MRLHEFTDAKDQLQLLRLIMDNTWSAISQEAKSKAAQQAAKKSRAAIKPRVKANHFVKKPPVPLAPIPPIQPLAIAKPVSPAAPVPPKKPVPQKIPPPQSVKMPNSLKPLPTSVLSPISPENPDVKINKQINAIKGGV